MSELHIKSSRMHIEATPSSKLVKSDRTRAAILDAALEFLWKHPFREMTVNRLMKRTGVSRSAFYQYFTDLHELMEGLLGHIQEDIMAGAVHWFKGTGEVTALLRQSLAALVRVGFEKGPILRAVADAAPTDARLERAWTELLQHFDDAVVARIEADQRQGLIPALDARAIAKAFNRMDAYSLIDAFGEHPRDEPEPLLNAMEKIWISTLYEAKQRERQAPLIRIEDDMTAATE
jgi:AcrR family transcriptional regulator